MKSIGRIASLVILVAAIAAVFIYKGGKPKADDTPPPVRPVKSIVVGAATAAPPLRFPGVVDANAGVAILTEGRIVRLTDEAPSAAE